MYRLIPEFIQSRCAYSQMSGSFHAVALFVDISGFTAITDSLMGRGQHGAEVMANVIDGVLDPLIQSVFAHGGFVTKLAGDAFTAVFPTEDQAHEARLRALAAAWRIRQHVKASGRRQTRYGEFEVSVKVGMAVGEVDWGIVSSTNGRRAAYYFQGPAIDGCAQAEKLAQAGEVVVDEAVNSALDSRVAAEPVEDHFRITAINGDLPPEQPVNPAPVDPAVLARFFPPEVTRQSLGGEFRQVASMFVSLPTVRTVEQLQVFVQIIFDLQDRYGGLLNGLDFGDKGANLLFFWGAPVAYENDVARALNFILDLQAQTVIPVNAGVTYRIAHAGYSGGALAGEYSCHGRGVSLAARFMQAASRGEIWIDENVAERAGTRFEIDFEGEMTFKGFARKQKVYVLLERKEGAERFYHGELLGREEEQAKLEAFVRPIWAGQFPGAMVIWGEPGIGKSRLADDFLARVRSSRGREFSSFTCQADEILRESLNPFRYWLRSYFGQSEQQSEARNKRSFNRKLDGLIVTIDDETLSRELDRTRSFLGALVNLEWPDSLYEQLDAQRRYENTFMGVSTLLKSESLQRPVILLIEDAHLLDEDSRAFLSQLTLELNREPYPIAPLATARPEGQRNVLGDDVSFDEIDLGSLSPRDLDRLAASQLGSPIGANLSNLLVERAEGNPFFAEQILRYLRERDLLVREGEKWELGAEQAAVLPSDVRALLVARLDRLTESIREVVQTASVLGREFEVRLLARMLQDDPNLLEKVAQAEHLAIWSAVNELRYLFRHALLRDAAYRMQVHARRRSLHGVAVEALEVLYEGHLGPHYGELAYHAEEAGAIDKARKYLESAGEAAKEAYQNSLAEDYFNRALKLTPDEDLEARYRLLLAREQVFQRQGARQEQLQDLEEMAKLAELLQDIEKQIKVLVLRAWVFWWMGDYARTLEAARQAETLAEASGEKGLAGGAHHVMSWVMLQRGDYERARKQAEMALAAALKADSLRSESGLLNTLGLIEVAEGDFFLARQHLEGYLRVSRERGSRDAEQTALNNLGVALVSLGDYEAAQDIFERSHIFAQEIGDQVAVGSGHVNLAWVAEARGDWDTALKHAKEGVRHKLEDKHSEGMAEALTWLGHAWQGQGHAERALAAYKESLSLRRELNQEHLAMAVLAGMARAALAQDDLTSASRYTAEILSYLDSGGSLDGTWEPLRIYLTCYRVLEAMQDLRASTLLEAAFQQLQEKANKIPDEDMRRMFLENVPWHREINAAYSKLKLSD